MPSPFGKLFQSRRKFLKNSTAALAAFSIPTTSFVQLPSIIDHHSQKDLLLNDPSKSLIGQYGPWAANLPNDPPDLSFRKPNWKNLKKWRKKASKKAKTCLAVPKIEVNLQLTTKRKYAYDGLEIEELSWQLPYGRATEAILLKPKDVQGPLPAVLGLHDHGGNKYFGKRKIIKTSDDQHPLLKEHQKNYYEGRAWANELAKRGFIVLVPDNFSFGSRRVWYQDVEGFSWGPLRTDDKSDDNPEKEENIHAYNTWAAQHEHIMAKSLFCGGTTWPGVFLFEDQVALSVLSNREDVDSEKLGCCGLSGGGLRTAYLGGLDERIKCAVCVGFMSTWRDFLLHKSYTHTWMTYIPILPSFLDFPEVLGLRAPRPTMVLNNNQDRLFTLSEMQKADRILSQVFTKAGAKGRYQGNFYDGDHKFDQAMQKDAFEWFGKWLK